MNTDEKNPVLAAYATKPLRKWLVAGLVLVLAGCAVPKHMQVRTGDDPENVDKDVRFRTTYYFRVFDQCAAIKPAQLSNAPSDDPVFAPETERQPVVLNDSLYRFRMTGKAHSLTSRVHFESGTLKAFQIDPFGANVAFDEETQRFYPVTQNETIIQAQRAVTLNRIGRLLTLREKLGNCPPKNNSADKNELQEKPGDCIPREKSIDKIDDLIAKSIESLADPTTAQQSTAAATPVSCPEGTKLRQGFQIIGPEGVRTFDQDERLIMAMTSSGKPLISVMQELSARILNQKAAESDRLLPFANERIKILKAHRIVDQAGHGDPENPDAVIRQAIEAFNGK